MDNTAKQLEQNNLDVELTAEILRLQALYLSQITVASGAGDTVKVQKLAEEMQKAIATCISS